MLSVYTRHHPDCKNAGDKTWRRCSCPKWIWGSLNGKFIRQSAKTHRWEEAEELRRQLSEGLLPATRPAAKTDLSVDAPVPHREGSNSERPQRPRVTVEKAVEAYLSDATSRGVARATHTKLTTIFRKQFLSWTQSQGFVHLDEIDLDALLNFRSSWSDAALAKQKKQSRLIGFFWACVRRRYLQENPALGLGKIKVVQIPTDYFPPEEFDRIIDATYRVCDNRGGFIDTDSNRTRLRTMTLFMRWSGLRIRDAITLERHRLHGDSLLLYQAKTGTPVYVPLPPFVVEALENLPAGPKPSLLLGHASVKITEKSYSPFVKARQVQLQKSVRNAWKLGQPIGSGPGTIPPVEYFRHGTLSLYAAFNTKTGVVLGKTAARHTSAEFVAFLADIVVNQPRGKEIHVIADNLSTHKTPQVGDFLESHPHVHLHFTPTYSSWLNQVELWFAKIERDVIARGVFTSLADLRRKLMKYIHHYNKVPKTVKWRYFDPTNRITPNSAVTGH